MNENYNDEEIFDFIKKFVKENENDENIVGLWNSDKIQNKFDALLNKMYKSEQKVFKNKKQIENTFKVRKNNK